MNTSCFARVHDAAVLGGGYAGFAAVRHLRARGRSVLWLEPQGGLLWEGGWAGGDRAGDLADPQWQAWLDGLAACGGAGAGRIDGAVAEIAAAAWLRDGGAEALLYAWPVAAHREDGLLTAVTVATKAGLRRVSARRWVDASEAGTLARLCGAPPVPAPATRRIAATLCRADGDVAERDLGPGVRWGRAFWPGESRLEIDLAADEAVSAGLLRGLDAASSRLEGAVVVAASCVALPAWNGGWSPGGLPANLALAVPAQAAVTTLAGRFALGLAAAARVADAPAAVPDPTLPASGLDELAAEALPEAAVAVVGLGTGGAVAAIAAGRAGAAVTAVEPLPFAGGIGTGGGIHYYYYGLKGGLQDVLDARVRALMPRFGAAAQVRGFHPDAKKAALDGLLAEAGVHRIAGLLAGVRRQGRRIVAAVIATADGPRRLAAPAWIDGTGDGDLCALAGATFRFGRVGDGLPHAFSQAAGRLERRDGRPVLGHDNFDQGFCDPADAEDLTAARIAGVAQYLRRRFTEAARPPYVAPALGLRQGRQVDCIYELTLDDLVQRRTFADVVGYTGCHYDNHASDYEYESADARYWVWACRQWRGRTAGAIPYRSLVPAALDNCWIASRCLGVSQDAHHSLRMQRDLQRIGEVAGLAAVQAGRGGHSAAALPLAPLQAALRASGALERAKDEDPFGPQAEPAWFATDATDDLAALAGADWGAAGFAMWRLARPGAGGTDALHRLAAQDDATASWRAACVLAQRGDAAARPRLWRALRARQWGYGEGPDTPLSSHRVLPDWMTAIALLGACGQAEDLPELEAALRGQPLHSVLAGLAAGAVAEIAGRAAPDAEQRAAAGRLLDRLASATAGAVRHPMQNPSQIADGQPVPAPDDQREQVRYDGRWQVRLAVRRARRALGLPAPVAAADAADPRPLVRRAAAG